MCKNVVLYIDAMIMPDKNAAAHRAAAICKSMMDMDMHPVIIGLEPEISNHISIKDTKKNYFGIDCFAVKYPKKKTEWLRRMVTIQPFLQVMNLYGIETIHSIIAMDYEVIALNRLRKYCKKKNIKLIADSVEWYGKSSLPFPMNIAKDIDTKLRMEHLYPRLDHMICISTYLRKYYEGKVSNIIEVPGTIDQNDEKWKRLPSYQGNEFLTIGYAGNPGVRFAKERIDWLIEAVCELNEEGIACRLIMAGVERDAVEKNLPHLHQNEQYLKSIQYLGSVSHMECLQMIASCDFSAIVRDDSRVTRAGFPTKFSESFGCGTPVITTQSSNVADYIVEGQTGFLCDDFSKDSVKQALKKAAAVSREDLVNMHRHLKQNNPLNYTKFNDSVSALLSR